MIPVFYFKKLRNDYGILCEPISGEFILIVNFSASVDKIDFSKCPSLKKEAALQPYAVSTCRML